MFPSYKKHGKIGCTERTPDWMYHLAIRRWKVSNLTVLGDIKKGTPRSSYEMRIPWER